MRVCEHEFADELVDLFELVILFRRYVRGLSSVKIQIEIVSAWLLRILKRLGRQEEFNGRRPYLRFFWPQIEYLSVLFVIDKILLVQYCLVDL